MFEFDGALLLLLFVLLVGVLVVGFVVKLVYAPLIAFSAPALPFIQSSTVGAVFVVVVDWLDGESDAVVVSVLSM